MSTTTNSLFISKNTVQRRLEDAERRLAGFDAERLRLATEIETLRSLLDDPVVAEPTGSINGEALRPTEAILVYANKHPGSRRRDLCRYVVSTVKSDSKNKQQNIRSTLKYLVKTGRLKMDGDVVWPVSRKES